MLVDEIWDFKSLNMGRELEIAGEFIYDSAQKAMSIRGLNNTYEINIILYTGAVGIERLQKIYLCLVAQNPTDANSMPKCLKQHNHTELQREVNKYSKKNVSKNAMSLLGVFADYYNNFRYANYNPGQHENDLRKLFIGFLKKLNGKFNFDEPCAAVQFEKFKKFYINELGKLAVHLYLLIHDKARELNTYAEYKSKKYDESFFEEHREPLTLYKAAKEAFKKYDGPIPTIRELDAEFQKLLQEKRQLYSEYKIARAEMQELLTAKQNVEQFLGKQNLQKQDIQKRKGETSL